MKKAKHTEGRFQNKEAKDWRGGGRRGYVMLNETHQGVKDASNHAIIGINPCLSSLMNGGAAI